MSRPTIIPHFDFPFRFGPGNRSVAVVGQGTLTEIANCCEVIIRYPRGYRIEAPDYGTPEQLFREGGVSLAQIRDALLEWEPRADALVSQSIGAEFDEFVAQVNILIQGRMEGTRA